MDDARRDVTDSGRTLSPWMPALAPPVSGVEPDGAPPDAGYDVGVVGAGIAGLTAAYLLARAGRRVAVFDDGPVGGGETGRTTGLISNYLDDGLGFVRRCVGEDKLRLAVQSHAAAIDQVESICRDEHVDADFARVPYYVFGPEDPSQADQDLAEEADIAAAIGYGDLGRADRAPTPGRDTGRCLRIDRQARFDAGRYLVGLADAVRRHGGRIFPHTKVVDLAGGRDGATVRLASGREVRLGDVVSCTNSPINPPVANLPVIHARQAPYRTFVVGVEVPAGDVEDALYADTLDPYHYARLADGGRLLIVGGEDHKTGHADDADERFERLEAWARRHWPSAGTRRFAWSGQVMETEDGLGYIGADPGDQGHSYLVTGDSGMGLTHGTLGAMLVRDLILGRDNPWADVYRPTRVHRKGLLESAKENLDAAWQYRDLVTPGEVGDPAELAPGQAAVVRRGLTKVAAYRDAAGRLHCRTAICPHLAGVVRWNSAECSWDCPIHGSRFDPVDGRQLNGPAVDGLAEADPQG